jgi:hypothetical protein
MHTAPNTLCTVVYCIVNDLLLLDSTPIECSPSLETTRRSASADILCRHLRNGYSRSRSRRFWGCRLHLLLLCSRREPRGVQFVPVNHSEEEVALFINHELDHPSRAIVDYTV